MAPTTLNPKDLGRIAGRIIDREIGNIDFSVKTDGSEYRRRWSTVQAAMRAKGYNVGYACGGGWIVATSPGSPVFDPIVEHVLVPVSGRPIVLAGCEGHHVVKEAADASGCDLCVLREFQISDEEYRNVKSDSIRDVVRKLKVGRRPRIAVWSPAEFLPHAQYEMLTETFGKGNVIYDPLVLQLIKYEKSLKELAIMEQANKVTDAAFRAMLAVTAPRVRESQVAGVGDFVCKALGAHRTGFRRSLPLGIATTRSLVRRRIKSSARRCCVSGHILHGTGITVVHRTVPCGHGLHNRAAGLSRPSKDSIIPCGRR